MMIEVLLRFFLFFFFFQWPSAFTCFIDTKEEESFFVSPFFFFLFLSFFFFFESFQEIGDAFESFVWYHAVRENIDTHFSLSLNTFSLFCVSGRRKGSTHKHRWRNRVEIFVLHLQTLVVSSSFSLMSTEKKKGGNSTRQK